MPKINLDMTAVTEAEIIAQMNKIEAMVEGRLDEDNIHQVAGKITALGKSTVNDIADFSNPIYADKFFGYSPSLDEYHTLEAVNFKTDVFERIRDYAWYADRFTVLSKKGTITLNYKNQSNLDKPSVVIAGDTEGVSLATQRRVVTAVEERQAKAYYDFVNAPEKVVSFGQALGTALLGGVVGFVGGFAAGGPIGAAIGVVVGTATAGAITQGINRSYNTTFDDSYNPYEENIQIMFYRHPPNFRLVSMLELTDLLSQYSDDEVRYSDNFAGSSPYSRSDLFSKNLYAVSGKTSIENNVAETSKRILMQIGQPMVVDADLTAIEFRVMPDLGTWDSDNEQLIDSDDDYVTALCEVDILFRIIT